MRRFYIDKDDITNTTATLKNSDANHIKNVLRLTPKDKIELFDGSGIQYICEIIKISEKGVTVSIISRSESTSEPLIQVILAQSILKDRKMDRLVRQLTELGMTHWYPFFSNRSIPRPDEKRLEARMKRWKKIATESLKQCRRGKIPHIAPPCTMTQLLEFGKECDLKIIFWEKSAALLSPSIAKGGRDVKRILLMLGPEGGFSSEEIKKAESHGFVTASLGPRILTAETAPLAACSIIQYLFGDMGNKNA